MCTCEISPKYKHIWSLNTGPLDAYFYDHWSVIWPLSRSHFLLSKVHEKELMLFCLTSTPAFSVFSLNYQTGVTCIRARISSCRRSVHGVIDLRNLVRVCLFVWVILGISRVRVYQGFSKFYPVKVNAWVHLKGLFTDERCPVSWFLFNQKVCGNSIFADLFVDWWTTNWFVSNESDWICLCPEVRFIYTIIFSPQGFWP